ncbi:hypothetical protein CTA2_9372 [Colletotrichum tanaceti]|uniref:Uncharacterized protein n=1 Tax=Colletotrichum tanaceti TaxID=1306861 RepID=A0A4U6X586_9PEZI|nr:hypothetical protein CTA2_9372 [Colletotrichum tanaceti]TKW50580.1 hypothetical protein CTA1_12265 [Colletotrichum tanaceti]
MASCYLCHARSQSLDGYHCTPGAGVGMEGGVLLRHGNVRRPTQLRLGLPRVLGALDRRLDGLLEPAVPDGLGKGDQHVEDGAVPDLGGRVVAQLLQAGREGHGPEGQDALRAREVRVLLDRAPQRDEEDAQDAAQGAAHLALDDVLELVEDGDDGALGGDPLGLQGVEEVGGARLEGLAAVAVAHDHVPPRQVGLGLDDGQAGRAQHGREGRRVHPHVPARLDLPGLLGGAGDELQPAVASDGLRPGHGLPVRVGLDVGEGQDLLGREGALVGRRRDVHEGDGEGGGVERGLERARVHPRGTDVPPLVELLEELVHQGAHLQVGDAAEIADQQDGLVAGAELDVGSVRVVLVQAVAQQLVDQGLRRRAGRDLCVPGLVVRPRPDLHLVGVEPSVFRAARHVAVVHRRRDGNDLGLDGDAELVNVIKRPGGGGGGGGARRRPADDLEDADLPGEASATDQAAALPADGDVVAAGDHAAVVAAAPRLLGGEPEVEAVAGVVCDDEDGADVGRHALDGGQDLLCGGAGEDVAGDGGRQHVVADVAGPRRLVAGAAAGHDADLGSVVRRVEDDAVGLVQAERGVVRDEAPKGLVDEALGRGEDVPV